MVEKMYDRLTRGERGQAATFVRVGVGIFIGLFLIGAIYNALDLSGLPSGVATAINTTLDQSVDAFGLLVVSLIVMAAVVIMGMLSQKGSGL